jgi:hypothetical protein
MPALSPRRGRLPGESERPMSRIDATQAAKQRKKP